MIHDAIFNRLFRPPTLPPVPLPPGGLHAIHDSAVAMAKWAINAAQLSFRVGVEQGFLAGCVFTLMVVQGLSAARNRKER